MSKRQILSAAKRKGLQITEIDYEWTPTPGESVPVWSISIDLDCADRFRCEYFVQLSSTAEVLDWINRLSESES